MKVSNPFRDPKTIDWGKFGQVVKNKLPGGQIELQLKVEDLEKAFEIAFKVSCAVMYSEKILPRWSKFRSLPGLQV